MFLGSDSEIGPNSLAMLSQDVQDERDYQTTEILVSAIVAKADYNCPAPPEAFRSLGPFVEQEVRYEQSRNRQGLINNSHQMAPLVTDMGGQGAIITDDEISSAPEATPLGSTSQTGGVQSSAFTPTQINAANGQPINWAETLTIQHSRRRYSQRINEELAPALATRSARVAQPGTPWGSPSGSREGWCAPGGGVGVSQNGWGKLFLFVGLGLVAVGILQDDGRGRQ